MGIPVANIYYLLCYAWDEFAPRPMTSIAVEDFPDTLHLFAHLLVTGVSALHRRGLEMGYVLTEEPTSTLRGQILIGETIRLVTRQPMKIVCAYDEMNLDILSNQIIKATLSKLLGEQSLQKEVRAGMRRCLSLLQGVRGIVLSSRVFHEVRMHQNNRMYSFLINVCRFFFECLEGQDQPGRYRFRDVDRDEKRMRMVFEKFVRNFFTRRQSIFKVKRDHMAWSATSIDGSDLSLLPQMRTDATLRSTERTIVIECKYTESLYRSQFFSEKLRSEHLYQLSAYLRNLEASSEPDRHADGILLYPTAGIALDQSYLLHGHRVRVKTLDLNRPWIAIEDEMKSLLLALSLP